MSLPIFLHSGMAGAPTLTASSVLDVFNTCLVAGFNSNSVSSATCSGGVVTLNFATDPGFQVNDTIKITGASNLVFNGNFRVIYAGSNQVTYSVPSGPSGVVAGTLSCKSASLGWESLFSGSSAQVFRSLTSVSQACLRIKSSGNNFYLRGFESVSDVDNGVNAFPTIAQVSGDGGEYYIYPYGSQKWVFIGDDKFFYFISSDSGNSYCNQLFFGDINSFVPVDNNCALISKDMYGPFGTDTSNSGYAMKSIGGLVSVSVAYLIKTFNKPTVPDSNTNNIVFHDFVFVAEAVGGVGSVRGLFPGAIEVLALANNTTPFFSIIDNVNGLSGRILMVKGYNNYTLVAFHLDQDWRL